MADMIPQGVQTEGFHGGYERGDASIRAVVISMSAILSMVFIVMIVALGGFHALRIREEKSDVPISKVFAREIPPEPRLLPSPITARDDMLPWDRGAVEISEQKAALNNYSFVDKERGQVSIPITQATRDVIAQNLPARTVPAGRGDLAQGFDTGAPAVTDADLDGSMTPDTTGGRVLDDEMFSGRATASGASASLGSGNLAASSSGETLNTQTTEKTAQTPATAGSRDASGTAKTSVVDRKVAPLGAR